ncbi:50S ribosomal protein L22 [Balneolaceae bacterium ANBcel3]|nr:50S ribosomal protein L22 [Balneolaceae bacterium ANBcel3]
MEDTVTYEAKAVQRYIRISPRKVRLVADVVRGEKVDVAMTRLKFTTKKAAEVVSKVIGSAAANLRDRFEDEPLDNEELVVREIYVDEGPTLKRIQPAPMGRAHPIRKRTSHITVVVSKKDAELADDKQVNEE